MLVTVAQFARLLSSVSDLDQFAQQAVDLIQEQFDLYYVGLFLVDETQQWATLRAGTGEAGQALVANAHKLPVGGASMVGQCIARRRPVVADDARNEAAHCPNPLLPDTKAEATLPLMVTSTPVGALTVQCKRTDTFDGDRLTALQTMADQLAVAVNHAQAQRRCREIVDAQRELIVRFRADGTVQYANPAFCRFFGDDAPRGKHVLDVMGVEGEDWERVRRSLETTGLRLYEYRVQVDGVSYWMTFTSREVAGGYQVVGRDETARIEAQQRLAESEERFRQLAENIPDGLTIIEDGRVVYVSDRICEITGRSRGELEAMRRPDFYAPEERDRLDKAMEAAQAGVPVDELEFWIVRPDGARRRVRNRYIAGDHSCYVVTSDITEQWRVEEYLRQSQKMEAMGRLAAGVAHDFNNYLTVIGSYVDLLLVDIQEGDARYPDVTYIQQAVRQSRALVGQLMTFSRYQQRQLHPQLLDLNHEISKAEGILQRLAGQDIELVTERGPDLGMVRADAGQIGQVLLNLVTNARDAIGGLGTITIRTEAWNGRAVLSVSDTGAGIDEAALPHIFEPFFTTKERGKGTGLGLATVYSIVQQSGGWIEAANREGSGAVFTIYFPSLEAI